MAGGRSGKEWPTFESLVADKEKEVVGCQVDLKDPMFSMVMFNCKCGTTLAIQAKEFFKPP